MPRSSKIDSIDSIDRIDSIDHSRQTVSHAWPHRLMRDHRLLMLCAASALAHLLVLGALARAKPRVARALPASALAVVLTPAAPGTRTASAPSTPAKPTATPAAASLAVAERGPVTRMPVGAALVTPAAPTEGSAPPPSALPGWDVGSSGSDTSDPHQPGFQAMQAPPSARLDYAVSLMQDVGAAPRALGSSALDWHSDDHGYRLALAGSAGVLGELASRGQATDNGLAPVQARGADGSVIDFDWAGARVHYAGSGDSAAISADAQDRASMLLRLSAIGLAGASQFDGGIELQVAGSEGIAKVRFEHAGAETIDTALGPLACIHLRQQTLPGQPRLEVWLATGRSWYPVQLRLTAADGAVLTQTVTSITPQ